MQYYNIITKIHKKEVLFFKFIILACDWYPVSEAYPCPFIDNTADMVNFIIRFSRMNVLVRARTTMERRLSFFTRVRGKSGSLARVL